MIHIILWAIGFIAVLSGCAVGYFAGPLWGGIVSTVGWGIMLADNISILVRDRREKREKKK